ncbi:MAG: fumarylacetoacetate hydrolase family protein [Alphaproteobacteria bacterium]
MKLATFTHNGSTRIGLVEGDEMIDLSAAAPDLPTDMLSFLQAGDAAMVGARAAQGASNSIPLKDVTLEAPVMNPGKVLAIGLNYMDHIEETGADVPKHQMWFNKQTTAVNKPYGSFAMPKASSALDYEAEMVFVIGKRCRHVPRERAHEVIAGYCVGNDVSVRDWQFHSQTMQIGKSFDTHAPFGPWITTSDEVGDPHVLDIKCVVNGEVKQDSNTKNLVFDCFDQIAYISQAFTLEPGDVLFTGTSGGVGVAMKPPVFLKTGDKVRIEMEKLGAIEHEVVAESGETVIG